MAYKIKHSKKRKMDFSENAEYYLVDIKENTYDPLLIKGWKNAVNLNLIYQLSTGNPNAVPMEKEWVLKNKKLKKSAFLPK
jgi:hypothetical protein